MNKVKAMLSFVVTNVRCMNNKKATKKALLAMDDRLLRDIGIYRGDITNVVNDMRCPHI